MTTTRNSLSNQQKLEICKAIKVKKLSQREAARWATNEFKFEKPLIQAAVSKIMKSERQLMQMNEEQLRNKRNRAAKFPELERELSKFVDYMEANNKPVSRSSLVLQAFAIARKQGIEVDGEKPEITFSDGWLTKFERRFGYQARLMHGEAGSVDLSHHTIQEVITDIKKEIANYDIADIYTIDETGLFYKQAPIHTMSN